MKPVGKSPYQDPSKWEGHQYKKPVLDTSTGYRVSEIAGRIWATLTFTAFVTTLATSVAVITSATVATVNILITSSVALSILLGILVYRRVSPNLPQKVRLIADYIEATVTEIFAMIALGLSLPLSYVMKEPYEEKECGTQQPILFVHGYLGHRSNWWYLRYRLREAGYKQIYTVNLGTPLHSIEEYAQIVDAKVKEIQKKTGCPAVKIVGHSMGGVIGSYYAAKVASKGSVSDVITLGSPLKGTRVAKIGIGECASQMGYKCDFVNQLRAMIKQMKKDPNNMTKFWHLGCENDLIIVPAASALASKNHDPKQSIMVPCLSHAEILFSDRVADWMTSIVGAPAA